MRLSIALPAAAVLALAPGLWPSPADASTIAFSSPYFRAANSVSVAEPGGSVGIPIVREELVTAGPEAALFHDVGFAVVESHARPLSLQAYSAAHGGSLDTLGYDRVIAEGVAWYETDFTITGGSGPVEILLEATRDGTSFTSDDPQYAFAAATQIQIRSDADGAFYVMAPWLESDRVELEHDVTYRLRMFQAAYSRATSGYETWNLRTLDLSLTIVPEPATGASVALGLVALGALRRRPRAAGG